jgi:DNA-binding beta-propeller fold protein YncE
MQNRVCRLMAVAAVAATASMVAGAQAVSTVIPFSAPTSGISVDPVRNKVYVVTPDPSGTIFNLAVIDGESNAITSTISLTSGAQFPAVDYLANRIYVTACNQSDACVVQVINGATDKVVSTIPITSKLGGGLTGIVVNPLTGLVYVANASNNVIDIVDGRNAKLIGSISLKTNSPSAIALNPVLNLLYVPYGSNQVGVIDAWNGQILSTSTFGTDTVGAAVNVLTGNVYVTDLEFSGSTSLTGVLNLTGHVTTSVTVNDFPMGVDVDPFTNLAFVASPLAEQLTVINGANNTVKATISGVQGEYVAVNPATQTVYTSGQGGVTVVAEK